MSELSAYLNNQKKQYLLERKQTGGKAAGFREFVRGKYQDDPGYFTKLALDAVMESTTKAWERQPRRKGPDLFSIADYTIPEYLTRPTNDYVSDDDLEDETESFEKVDHEFATVQDLLYDATIKLRKAAQSSAVAEREMKAVDDARRRARGNMTTLLRDIADAPVVPSGAPQPETHPAA
jgi:hypothetical protein